MILKIAWRNIWRNKRRTLITMASIFFAVLLGSFTRSLQLGMYDKMVDNLVRYENGYLQIQNKDYQEDPLIDNSFNRSDSLQSAILSIPGITLANWRIEGFALSISDSKNAGVLLMGMDPPAEEPNLQFAESLVSGRMLKSNEKGILVASKLAKKLRIETNDTLVLMGQGYHGSSAADKFLVVGIVKYKNPELDNQMIFMPLEHAQSFFGCEGRVTGLNLLVDDPKSVNAIQKIGKSMINNSLSIRIWEDMMPEIKQVIQADAAGGIIVLLILYTIIGFGMFGTVLMMTTERKYEFGVMIAVGMKKMKLVRIVFLETVIMALLAASIAIGFAYIIMYYIHYHPIPMSGDSVSVMEEYGIEAKMYASIDIVIAVSQALIVLIMSTIICIFPSIKILNIKPVAAMRN